MAIRSRLYIFEESGAIKRVPRRVRDDLIFGDDAIPEYAGTRQKLADVLVENENGKPVRILDVTGSYWIFDKEGRIDRGPHSHWALAMDLAFQAPMNKKGKVVDLRPELKRKKFDEEHSWTVTNEDLNRITADLWPHLANAERIQTIKGKAQKRPPLTHEAKRAFSEINAKIVSVQMELEDLSEAALKGLAYEANQAAKAFSENRHLWNAVAAEADRQREIKARHRTGRGTFYAVLRVWHRVSNKQVREADTAEVKCQGKKAAIEAARRLLAENAHRFSENVTIEAEVVSELEWEPVVNDEPSEDGSSEASTA